MNILLLGGAGFVGLNLADALLQRGHRVSVVDRQCSAIAAQPRLGQVRCYTAHVTDLAAIVSILDNDAIDWVVNLASGLIPSSNFDEFLFDMAEVTIPSLKLLEAVAARGIQYLFFSSGGTVYGQGQAAPLAENSPCAPISFYGQSKKTMEDHILFASRHAGLRYLILRPSNPYGRFQNPERKQGFVTVALDRLIRGEALEIWGNGSVVRDYLHVDDLTSACCQLLEGGICNRIFNVGSGVGHSLKEVLEVLSAVCGKKIQVSYLPARKVDVQHIVLDIVRLQGAVDFVPLSLTEGIARHHRDLMERYAP